MMEKSLSPLLIFAVCNYCKHNVRYWTFIYFQQTATRHVSASAYHRTESDENHTSKLMSAVQIPSYRDPVCRQLPACHHSPILKEIYPWSASRCTLLERVGHWSAISRIRMSVRRGGVARPFRQPYMIKRNLFSSIAEQPASQGNLGQAQVGTPAIVKGTRVRLRQGHQLVKGTRVRLSQGDTRLAP